MRLAKVENGVVTNVAIPGKGGDKAYPGWIACDDSVSTGYIFDGITFTPPTVTNEEKVLIDTQCQVELNKGLTEREKIDALFAGFDALVRVIGNTATSQDFKKIAYVQMVFDCNEAVRNHADKLKNSKTKVDVTNIVWPNAG